MAGDELVCGLTVGMFRITLGEHVLFLRLQHRELADFVEITIEAGFSGSNGWQGITGHDFAPSYSRSGSFWGRICAFCEADQGVRVHGPRTQPM